ncbi:MAG: sarcosine oxidase subunit gamma [Gammaproteobacteria bacterium]
MADQLPTRFAPGRYGKAEGRPGVQVRERHIGLLASVIARRGAAPAAAAAIERLPDRAALTVLGVGPGHWWIESAASARSADDLQTMFEGVASVFDLTDSRVVFELGGPRIRDTLAKMLPIDLHPSVFRPGDVAVTIASHIGVTLWRTSDARTAEAQTAGAPQYRLAVARSYAASFWRGFVASAAEYGCDASPEVSP